VTAYDAGNNVVTGYTGQVYFTSTDGAADLPYTSGSRYTFTSGTDMDNGVHTFLGFTLNTAGSRTITVTDGIKSATTTAITVTNPSSNLYYSTSMTPTSTRMSTSTSYAYTITRNSGSGTTRLGWVTIQVPAGFTGISVTSVTASGGRTWVYSVNSNTITVHAQSSTDELISSGQTVTVVFSATAPSSLGTYGPLVSTVHSNYQGTGYLGTLNGSDPTVTVTSNKANPDIASSFTPHSGIQPGNQVTDTAKLVNATVDAGGSFTYRMYSGIYPSGTLIDSDTKMVANGVVPDSKAFTVLTQGSYYFINEYSGDSNNSGITSYSPESFIAWPSAQTVVLRPSGDTDDNHLGTYPASTPHYQCVNQVSPDGDTTYVYAITSNYWTDDTYQLPNLAFTSGTINYVTIHAVARTTGYGSTQLSLTTHGNEYDGTDNSGYPFPLTSSWLEYTAVWSTNPYTHTTWTIQEINDLLVGCSLYKTTGDARCTQVYVEVYYTP
jgi:hypothetical protein